MLIASSCRGSFAADDQQISADSLSTSVGKQIAVSGKWLEGKSGPYVLTKNDEPVYIEVDTNEDERKQARATRDLNRLYSEFKHNVYVIASGTLHKAEEGPQLKDDSVQRSLARYWFSVDDVKIENLGQPYSPIQERHLIDYGVHERLTKLYENKDETSQLQEIDGLCKAFIAGNETLSHNEKEANRFTKLVKRRIARATSDSELEIFQLAFYSTVVDELVDSYRLYREEHYEMNGYYRTKDHTYGFTDKDENKLGHILRAYGIKNIERAVAIYRLKLVLLCGPAAVDSLDKTFRDYGWYVPKTGS